ncbi:MAG: ribonuclease P protein component [Alkalinema sp. CACIAM 70d]|nr:MAG: ribonuclease P protein component [Alkalinema sp. CACIAM 70d]
MALPKANRLKHRQDFDRVYQRGKRRRASCLHLVALRLSPRPSPEAEDPTVLPLQIGISISKKVSKHAVVRNRIKRRIKAALRQFLPRMTTGWKLVVVVRAQAVECDYWKFLQELEQLLVEAEVLHGS